MRHNETHRYVEKMSNEQIAKDLGISRNTVSARMKDLIALRYVIKEGRYYLVPKTDYYTLIPVQTLDFLLNYIENREKIIKLYIVLYDYFILNKPFTMQDLHEKLGYNLVNGKPNSRNSAQIRTCLMILSEAGLIDYEISEGRNAKGAATSAYKITMIRSNIDDKYKMAYKMLKEAGEVQPSYEAIVRFYEEMANT